MHLSFVSPAPGYLGNSVALAVVVRGFVYADIPADRGACTGLQPWLDGDHLGREFELGPRRGCPMVWGLGLCR